MKIPQTRDGRPGRGAAAELADQQGNQPPQRTAPRRVVSVTAHGMTATVAVPDGRAERVLRRAVPAHGRERDGARWSLWARYVPALVAALEGHGYRVERGGSS